jgi:4-hydroxybenzoate polyprenyltransferase
MPEAYRRSSPVRPAFHVQHWLELTRVRQWFHLLPLPIAGYEFEKPLWSNFLPITRGVGIAFCVLAFGYLLNAVADREIDLDQRKNPLAAVATASYTFHLPLLLLASVAVGLAATASLWVGACTAVCLLSGGLYSVGPRLKSVPFVGTFMNLTNFLPLLFVGTSRPAPSPRLIALAASFGAMLLQNQLIHEAGDAPEDRGGRLETTFLRAGPRGTALLAAACGLAVLVTSAWAVRRLALPGWMALHAFPYVVLFPLLLVTQGDSPTRMRTTRKVQRWCAVASGALLFLGLR